MQRAINIDEAIGHGAGVLAAAGVADPRREASSLVAFILSRDRAFLVAHPEHSLSDRQTEEFRSALARRAAREPLQYITGRQELWGIDFVVTPDVLIPRPETEILVEEAVRLLSKIERPRFAEAGTGSGCISVSILHSVPAATAIATDISGAALAVAQQNARKHKVSDRLELIEADVLNAVTGPFDLIVSNPPYVPEDQIDGLQPEVRDHEPRLALAGGDDGLEIVDKIVDAAPRFLRTGASLLMEIGFDQSERVEKRFPREVWKSVEFLPDLQGIPRIVKATRI